MYELLSRTHWVYGAVSGTSDNTMYLPCRQMTSFLLLNASLVGNIYAEQKPFPLLISSWDVFTHLIFYLLTWHCSLGDRGIGCISVNNAEVTDLGFKMKLRSIEWETKVYNSPLATDVSVKIISHALISTVSFYWVASCVPSIKLTEDAGGSHLQSNARYRLICPGGREVCRESSFPSSVITSELVFENSRGWSFPLPTLVLLLLFVEQGNVRSVQRQTKMIELWEHSLAWHLTVGLGLLIFLWWVFF